MKRESYLLRSSASKTGLTLRLTSAISVTTSRQPRKCTKLPVFLRVLRAGEELPRTLSGKVMKNQIREKYFQLSGYRPRDYAVPGVEVWDLRIDMKFIQNAGKIMATVPSTERLERVDLRSEEGNVRWQHSRRCAARSSNDKFTTQPAEVVQEVRATVCGGQMREV